MMMDIGGWAGGKRRDRRGGVREDKGRRGAKINERRRVGRQHSHTNHSSKARCGLTPSYKETDMTRSCTAEPAPPSPCHPPPTSQAAQLRNQVRTDPVERPREALHQAPRAT